jgi:hypothetical protein
LEPITNYDYEDDEQESIYCSLCGCEILAEWDIGEIENVIEYGCEKVVYTCADCVNEADEYFKKADDNGDFDIEFEFNRWVEKYEGKEGMHND